MHPFQQLLGRLALRLARIPFVERAIIDQADLSAFRGRPGPRVIAGVAAIAISYVIGWPMVSLLGALAVYYGNAAIAVIGGPLVYGLSHLVFILGMYLAGAKYSHIFLRWAARRGVERLLVRCGLPLPAPTAPDVGVVAGHDEAGRDQGPQPAAAVAGGQGRSRR